MNREFGFFADDTIPGDGMTEISYRFKGRDGSAQSCRLVVPDDAPYWEASKAMREFADSIDTVGQMAASGQSDPADAS